MNDRTRPDDERRNAGQQSGWESGSGQSWQQGRSGQPQGGQGNYSGGQDWGHSEGRQQGGWDEGYRNQQHQRGMSRADNQSGRPWGGSSGSGQQGGQWGGYGGHEEQRQRASGGAVGASGYGWSEQGDADRQSGGRSFGESRDWAGDFGGSDRGSSDWRTRDNWRNPGSQSFASDYGMRDGQNYDERFRRQGFGGGASNPTFGRGYGPDYGRDPSGDDGRSGGRERGFFERAGDEIASWFGAGDSDHDRERGRDYRTSGQSWRGESYSGHGPSDYTRSDERIREDVNDRLTDDPRVDARKITVSVDKGEVTLNGTVVSREAKRRAEDCIDRISGVKHVQNNLRIESQSGSSFSTGSTGSISTSASGTTATGSGATMPTSTTGTSGVTGGSSGSSGGSTAGASGSPTSATSARKDS